MRPSCSQDYLLLSFLPLLLLLFNVVALRLYSRTEVATIVFGLFYWVEGTERGSEGGTFTESTKVGRVSMGSVKSGQTVSVVSSACEGTLPSDTDFP